MAVPTVITDLSDAAVSNSPAGSDNIGTSLDDFLRAHGAFIRQLFNKVSVRVATTANGTLSTAYENGDTVDGVVLATGDRILLKDQSTGSQNGIYIVNASGAPTRATDADSSDELLGSVVFVRAGTANSGKIFACTNTSAITLGSTSITYAQVGGTRFNTLTVDTINENTAAAGVTIDSVLLKDGGATLSGDLVVDTNTLVVNAASNFVGLGTTTRYTSGDGYLNIAVASSSAPALITRTGTTAQRKHWILEDSGGEISSIGSSSGVLELLCTAGIRLGSGSTPILNVYSATATLDFTSRATNTSEVLTITVTGAAAGDAVVITPPAALSGLITLIAWVSSANTVSVRCQNLSSGTIDPASGTFRATVIKF